MASSMLQRKRKQSAEKTDITKSEVDSLKAKLNPSSNDEKIKLQKKKQHQEAVLSKQKARLSQHIERVKNKEARGPAANKERFYVTNAKLLEELYIWRDSAPESRIDDRIITEEFGKMVKMIAERLTNHSNFKHYSRELKEDMVSYACFKCIQGIRNYNFEFKNAFAYFTTACYNAFISIINKYYKQKNLNRELAKRALQKLEATSNINSSKILNQFIKDYIGEEFVEGTTEGDNSSGESD